MKSPVKIENFWPEFDFENPIETPATFLKKQASLLGSKTKNIVLAEVLSGASVSASHPFTFEFVLVAPLLNNYRYKLFAIKHNIDMFPVELEYNLAKLNIDKAVDDSTSKNAVYSFDNEDTFKKAVGEILKNKETEKIIKALYSQSK